MSEDEIESPECPTCENEETVPIAYGYPADELLAEASRGRVVLGGCVISDDSPRWYCPECGHSWGRIPLGLA